MIILAGMFGLCSTGMCIRWVQVLLITSQIWKSFAGIMVILRTKRLAATKTPAIPSAHRAFKIEILVDNHCNSYFQRWLMIAIVRIIEQQNNPNNAKSSKNSGNPNMTSA